MIKRTILITGISGFTGFNLYKHITRNSRDFDIVGIDKNPPLFSGKFEFEEINILNFEYLYNFIAKIKPFFIFHLAGINFSKKLKNIYDHNVFGTINLLEVLKSNKFLNNTRVLIIGSSAEYGQTPKGELPISENNPLKPITHYGISKVAQDLIGYKYHQNFGLKIMRVRPFNLIGPSQSSDFVCGSLAKQIVEVERGFRRPYIYVGNLESSRDFIDVRDAVEAYWEVITKGKCGEVYNIGSGRCYSIKEILNIFLELTEKKIAIKQKKQRKRAAEISIQISNLDKIKIDTGWMPKINFRKSLQDMLDFLRASI